jgi:hypothetical protein
MPFERVSDSEGYIMPFEQVSDSEGYIMPFERVSDSEGYIMPFERVSDSEGYIMPFEQFFSYIMERTSYILMRSYDVHFGLDQHALLDFYCTSSLKQQSVEGHFVPLGHIISIPS